MTGTWRSSRILLGCLVVLLLLTGIATAAVTRSDRSTSPPCLGADPGAGFAVDADFTGLSSADLGAELAEMRAGGAMWVRLDADWSRIEPQPGAYDWASTDRVVAAARAHGLHVLLLLTYAPSWARPAGTGEHGGPATLAADAAFGRFAGRAAVHYGAAGVTDFEIWNEPNVPQFWEPHADASDYSRLLVAASAGIRSAQPAAMVVSGGLAPADDADGAISPLTFTSDLYTDGAGDAFDALGVHPYSYPVLPLAPNTLSFNAFQRSALLHDVLARHGQGGKQLWFTEFGAPTGTSSRSVTPAAQAEAISQAFGQLPEWPWAGPLFVYELRDNGSDTADAEQNFGLLTTSGRAKPAYDTYRSEAARRSSPEPGCAASVRRT